MRLTPKRLSLIVLFLSFLSLVIGARSFIPAVATADQIQFRLSASSTSESLLVVGGTKARCPFVLKNGSSAPILLVGLTSSCTCMAFPDLPRFPRIVKPREKLELVASIETSPSRYDTELAVQIQVHVEKQTLSRICRFVLDCIPPVEVIPSAVALDDRDRPVPEITRLRVWVADGSTLSETPVCRCDLPSARVKYVPVTNPAHDAIRRMTHVADLDFQIGPDSASGTGFITLKCDPFGNLNIPVCIVKTSKNRNGHVQ